MKSACIFVVEDDPAIRNVMLDRLIGEGYAVDWSDRIKGALQKLEAVQPELLVLDLNLPDGDGLALCKRLAANLRTRGIPIMMVSARGANEDIVDGLGAGAQDYMVKPFNMQEFLARVRAIVRRSAVRVGMTPDVLSGRIRLSTDTYEAWVSDQELKLTLREFEILHFLISNQGRAHSREAILAASRAPANISERVVDVHVSHLRAKLGEEGKRIVTVPQVGFKMREALPGLGA